MLLRASLVSGNVYGESLVLVILIYPVCLVADEREGASVVRRRGEGRWRGKDWRWRRRKEGIKEEKEESDWLRLSRWDKIYIVLYFVLCES